MLFYSAYMVYKLLLSQRSQVPQGFLKLMGTGEIGDTGKN